jgi:hypothetical protein
LDTGFGRPRDEFLKLIIRALKEESGFAIGPTRLVETERLGELGMVRVAFI